MDLNQVSLIIVGVGAVVTLYRSVALLPVRYNRGWIGISLAVLMGMLILWLIVPDYAGILALLVWLVLVIVPGQLITFSGRLANTRRYPMAIRLARLAAWLHPMDGYPTQADLIRSIQLEQAGDIPAALALLERYRHHPLRRTYTNTQYFRLSGQYDEMVKWFEVNVPAAELRRDPTLIQLYIQALGMTGKLNAMIAAFTDYKPVVERLPQQLPYIYLMIFANCGRVAQVEQLISTVYAKQLTDDGKRLWLALAQIAAGDADRGKQTLNALLNSPEGNIRAGAERALRRTIPPAADMLTPESAEQLVQLERHFEAERRFTGVSREHAIRPWLTYALIAANLAVFLLEIQQGGDSDMLTLYRLGALYPPSVFELGEWWRVGAYMFLHFGVVHLALNMLGLLVLGPFVERNLRWLGYLLVYFGSGLGAGLLFLALAQAQIGAFELIVGASGAIMGLVGAAAAIYGYFWRKHQSRLAQRGLRRAALIILLQVGVDLAIPETSLTGHLSGAVIGFSIAIIILLVTQRKQTADKKVVI